MNIPMIPTRGLAAIGLGTAMMVTGPASADQVINDDLIVSGSLCVGFDCVNGESFGFDTIRLKENNTRIKFQDTSSSGSFPTRDWQITVNDSTNGGADKFSIDDIDGGRTPFTIIASAPSNSIFVNSSGNVGFGTATPAVTLHARSGNTPTLRLEQDGSSGFTAQTWDIASNETNFFIRDATNGSQLPLRIRPSAPSNSIFVDADGDIGLGTASPTAPLHVRRTDGTATVLVEEASGTVAGRTMLTLSNNGPAFLRLENTNVAADARWVFSHDGTGNLGINRDGGINEFFLDPAGNLTLTGTLTTGGAGTCSAGCDRVFDADYPLPSITEQQEMMFSNRHLPNVGPTDENGPFNISHKMGGMLNELEKAHIYIAQLNERISVLEEALVAND